MKTAIYPGSFNPWHEGHQDVLEKSLKIFDRVILARGINPEKALKNVDPKDTLTKEVILNGEWNDAKIPDRLVQRVIFLQFAGFLHEAVEAKRDWEICAVIRGLRNGYDLQAEINQQYWYEDLGLKIPLVYFVTDRKLGHVSSSAIRQIESIRKMNKNQSSPCA